ncbi:MAG: triose-phosphate isomerase [Simkania sp.]|nr:triose-phosphate isomerase [Nanoarchaeota archaeon]MCB1084454.1 triose-phosphate isomerase [Simkania sp.]
MIEAPLLMINFKTYDQASGKEAVALTKYAAEVSKETKKSIICCVQAADLHACSKNKIPLFGEHVDIEPAGGHTGKVSIKALIENGMTGCLINHSENRIPFTQIMETIALLQEADMVSVVCVKDEKEAKKIAKLTPDIIAIEPPELIGGDISVTTADPAIVKKSVEAVRSVNEGIPVLCGAGVKTGKDVKAAIKLGAMGVLVASGITKAKDQKKAILQLTKGL